MCLAQAAKDKMCDIGVNLESGALTDGTVDSTEVTAFCLGAIFDFHNLLHLKVKHEGGETIAAELLGLSDKLKRCTLHS